jgi:rhodanese-related sulfurtransferase
MNIWSQLKHWLIGGAPDDTAIRGYRRITAHEARELLQRDPGAKIVDVRLEMEYRLRHIPGSILIPLSILATQAPIMLPEKHTAILVHCHGGHRSIHAVRQLLAMGYSQVYDLGGITNWPYETVTGKAH